MLAQNTAWISIFNFQAVFSERGRRLAAENGRRTPPGFRFLIFRRCFQSEGAVSRRSEAAPFLQMGQNFEFEQFCPILSLI